VLLARAAQAGVSRKKEKTMALVACHECGKEISAEARICPHCGARNKNRKKSWASRLLITIFVIGAIYALYYIFEPHLNPNIPTCESSLGRRIFIDMVEKTPWAQHNLIKVLDVIEQKDISSGPRPEDRVCEVTFRLSNVTNKTYIFTFEDKEKGGYFVRAKPK
jgi:predicted nucleic acid-binding Zn ribbon protein